MRIMDWSSDVCSSDLLLSLIAAAVGLPLLLRGMAVDEDPEAEEEKAARLHACEAAIEAVTDASRRAVDKPKHDIDEVSPLVDAASRLIDNYESRINGLREEQNTDRKSTRLNSSH